MNWQPSYICLAPLLALKKSRASTCTCLHIPLQNRMYIVLPVRWDSADRGQHKSCRHSTWAFLFQPSISPQNVSFFLSPATTPETSFFREFILPSVPQDTFQWLRTRQHLKHSYISSFLMEERGRKSHLQYCAFLLVLADPLCDTIDQIFYEEVVCPSLYQSNSTFRPLWGRMTSLSLAGEVKTRNCAWPPSSCVHPTCEGQTMGLAASHKRFVCNNCGAQTAPEIYTESMCCPGIWPIYFAGLSQL